MARRRKVLSSYPPHWEVTTTTTVNGRTLQPGTEVSIRGERGRFRFIKAVRTPTAFWLDFVGGPKGHYQWRSFGPARVRTVHRISKLRENQAT